MASKQSEKRAAIALRDIDKLARRGVRGTRSLSKSLRSTVIRGFQNGRDVSDVIREELEDWKELFLDGLVVAHLSGRLRQETIARRAVNQRRRAAGIVFASVFDSAVSFLTNRLQMTDAALDDLEDVYGPRAATIVDEVGDVVDPRVQVAVRDAVREGLTVPEATARIREAFDAAGVTVENPHLFEQIFRTQSQMAYSAGAENAWRDPDMDAVLWGFEYVPVGDDRVRPNHAELDGFRATKDDPIWRSHTPPNGFNCRCQKVAILKGDPLATPDPPPGIVTIEVDGEPFTIEPGPDKDFDFNPGDVFRDSIPASV